MCDNGEAVELVWATPASILNRAAAGEGSIMFPTRLNISRLADSASAEEAMSRARIMPIFTVLPWVEERPDDTAVMIPAEAGYVVTENFVPATAPS